MGRPRLLELDSGPAVAWLFLDFNAYFASVEQQERPELRGRPVGVVPLVTPNTVCIAASYEAKRFGVRTGTKVKDAQALCPEIALVVGRPKLYVEYHQALLEAVETCVPITAVMSIDEAACRLQGLERWLPNALAIAVAVKRAVHGVGETLRCSIGLAPNRYLAKVAADMEKPDGLTTLLKPELPQALLRLKPGDLPGIGRHTEAKLKANGITTMEQLCRLSREEMRRLWGGVQGERLWHWMRGADFNEPAPERKSLGRQHVLAPEHRSRDGAFAVAKQLLHHAAAELRRLDLWAGGLGVAVNFLDDAAQRDRGPWVNAPSWKAVAKIEDGRDIFTLHGHLRRLWERCPARRPILVYVWLSDLVPDARHSLPLFGTDVAKQDRASAVMDALNRRFGAQMVYPGGLHATRDATPTRIAFRHVPKLENF